MLGGEPEEQEELYFRGRGLWHIAQGLLRHCDDLIFYAGEMKKPSEGFVQRRDLMFYICKEPLTLCAVLSTLQGARGDAGTPTVVISQRRREGDFQKA